MVSVILYHCMLCVALCHWICLFCVLHVYELFVETIHNMFGMVVIFC